MLDTHGSKPTKQPVAWGEFYGGKIVAVSLYKSHHYTVPLYTRPSPAPEAQQEAMTQFRRTGCSDWYDGLPDHTDGGGPYETRVLYTRPLEQAVTEEMVGVAAKAVVAEWQKMVAETSPHMSPGDHARAFVSPGNYRLIRAALKAAMEGKNGSTADSL